MLWQQQSSYKILFYVFDNNFWPGAGADYFFPEVGAD